MENNNDVVGVLLVTTGAVFSDKKIENDLFELGGIQLLSDGFISKLEINPKYAGNDVESKLLQHCINKVFFRLLWKKTLCGSQ